MRWTSLLISMTTFILLCFRDIDGPFLLPPVACLEPKETILDLLKYNLKVMQGAAIFYTVDTNVNIYKGKYFNDTRGETNWVTLTSSTVL